VDLTITVQSSEAQRLFDHPVVTQLSEHLWTVLRTTPQVHSTDGQTDIYIHIQSRTHALCQLTKKTAENKL